MDTTGLYSPYFPFKEKNMGITHNKLVLFVGYGWNTIISKCQSLGYFLLFCVENGNGMFVFYKLFLINSKWRVPFSRLKLIILAALFLGLVSLSIFFLARSPFVMFEYGNLFICKFECLMPFVDHWCSSHLPTSPPTLLLHVFFLCDPR